MKLDSNDLTRRQNIMVVLVILISIFGGYYLTQFIGALGEIVALFGLMGGNILIIYIRDKNVEEVYGPARREYMERNRKARLVRKNR